MPKFRVVENAQFARLEYPIAVSEQLERQIGFLQAIRHGPRKEACKLSVDIHANRISAARECRRAQQCRLSGHFPLMATPYRGADERRLGMLGEQIDDFGEEVAIDGPRVVVEADSERRPDAPQTIIATSAGTKPNFRAENSDVRKALRD